MGTSADEYKALDTLTYLDREMKVLKLDYTRKMIVGNSHLWNDFVRIFHQRFLHDEFC